MPEAWEGGDATKGAKIFKERCTQCHSVKKGGAHGQGPNLWSIIDTMSGQKPGFRYTTANKEKGVVWDKKNLYDYLENPKEFIPGTRMVFAGLKMPKDRRDIIAYIATLKD